jgi:hypothetical protein
MKIQIDLKSAVCGLMIGVAAMFAMGAGESSSNQAGRYQVSTGAGISVMVDSKTGQAWVFNSGGRPRNDGNFFDIKNK